MRSSLGTNSEMAMIPPGARALKTFFSSFAGSRFSLAVQDCAERGDVKAIAVIGFQDVAFDGAEAIGKFLAAGDATGDGKDGRPIDGGDPRLREFLGQAESPNAGAGGDVQNIHLSVLRKFRGQVIGQGASGGITQIEKTFDEFAEEFGPPSSAG